MRTSLSIAALALVLVAALAVRGHSAGPPATRIGYIDLRSTLAETKAGKAARDRLEAEKKEKQKLVDSKKDEFKKQVEEFDKQRVVMRPELASKRERELQDQYVKLQEYFLGLQQELAKKEAELTQDIFKNAQTIIQSIAKRDGYTMILEKTESAVLWDDGTTNITPEVNRRLDAGEK